MLTSLQYPLVIADLHCDLLCYLSRDPRRTPFDRAVRCSIPQLREGHVKIQTMAIFSETVLNSSLSGWKQADMFRKLPVMYPDDFSLVRNAENLNNFKEFKKIGIVAAIENMSALCSEEDDLEKQLEKLTLFRKHTGNIMYLSLTWNTENRFGGGSLTNIGLKDDGKKVVDYLCDHNIALDLSHASDYLAYGLLDYIDRRGLKVSVLASHSNMRTITNFPRNLPDDIAKEIIKREGLIGINFIRYLLGKESPNFFARHIEHLLVLGGANSMCFGADFFYPNDVAFGKSEDELFFPSFDHAGTYPCMLNLLRTQLALPEVIMEDLCYNNVVRNLVKGWSLP
ncbi:MAG: membrane dipeptidase [Parachlamydiaceae bacterium]